MPALAKLASSELGNGICQTSTSGGRLALVQQCYEMLVMEELVIRYAVRPEGQQLVRKQAEELVADKKLAEVSHENTPQHEPSAEFELHCIDSSGLDQRACSFQDIQFRTLGVDLEQIDAFDASRFGEFVDADRIDVVCAAGLAQMQVEHLAV